MKSFMKCFIAVLSVSSISYAGFTEINSSGDIISKEPKAVRMSFSSQYMTIPAPLRTYSLWDKISETTKYKATVKTEPAVIETPTAIESSKAPISKANNQHLVSASELNKIKNALKKSEAENERLTNLNSKLKTKVETMDEDIKLLKEQVNFLANQIQQVESDVLVMKHKKTSGFFARN